MTTTLTSSPSGSSHDTLRFTATNVTGTVTRELSVPPGVAVGDVTRSLASSMNLPTDVPYSLRDDKSSEYLLDDRPVGEQLAPEAHVTLTPKAHLG